MTTRWDITWGKGIIETRPWPRFKAKWKRRIGDAWAVLRGKAFVEFEDDEGNLPEGTERYSIPAEDWAGLYRAGVEEEN